MIPDIQINDAADIAALQSALLELKCMGLKLSVRIVAEEAA
jgi:hypothetical protein